MPQTVPSKESKSEEIDQEVGSFGMWVNDHIVGNPITFVLCILAVIIVYAVVPFQGYAKWNTGVGLFFNTLSSSFELITGVGAVVGVVVLHKAHKKQKKSLDDLHSKVDKLLANKQ
jgi:low affinity Fe/Cu permease